MGRMLLFGFAMALGACASGDDAKPTVAATFGAGLGGDGTTSETGVTPAATSAPQPDTDTETAADGSTGTGGNGGSGEPPSESESSSGPTGSTGTPSMACDPNPEDNECFVCARANCCPEVEACADSPMCTCALECLADGWDPQTCVVGCGVDAAVTSLVLCGATVCEVPCDAAL